MKIEKIIKTFAIAALAVGSVFTFSQTTEAATISIEKAAQKIYKAETKAYNTKKDVSVTVKLASASSKKAIKKVTGELEDALIKAELGDVDLTYVLRGKYIRPAIGGFLYGTGNHSDRKGSSWGYFYYPTSTGAYQKGSYKSGVLTVKFDIKGSKKWYRDQYYENTCLAKCVKELREQINGMSEKDKAWTVGEWAAEHLTYYSKYEDGSKTKYSLIWSGDAYGDCEQEARAYQLFACLMGLDAGFVYDDDHAWNCVKIDGTVYYLDGTDAETREWEAFVKGQANASIISNIIEVKEWVDGTTVGEWCLLTAEEYDQMGYLDSKPSQWEILWKLGSRFF